MMEDLLVYELEELHARTYAELLELRQDEEGFQTETSIDQNHVERDILELYKLKKKPILMREKHINLLRKSLFRFDESYGFLDCSRPWRCYWVLHSLQLLGVRLEAHEYSYIVNFLAKCQSPEGGFGGGPGQYPHLASTYAAVNALCTIGTPEAYQVIDRKGLKHFLMTSRDEDGSFKMHVDGEVDIRAIYCALSVAKLTNVYTPEMFKGSAEWIATCQTWEGGFAGYPGAEAHGGYSYCGLAALVLLGQTSFFCLKSFLRWVVNRQRRLEGGFEGRTNKLVDGCYSFWQGGAFPLIHGILANETPGFDSKYWLFDQKALQEYVLICCQHPLGGLLDKPEKNADMYHTCYDLSGLAIAQHSPKPLVVGPVDSNAVKVVQPLYNLQSVYGYQAMTNFSKLSIPD